jgi:hypothetical protein
MLGLLLTRAPQPCWTGGHVFYGPIVCAANVRCRQPGSATAGSALIDHLITGILLQQPLPDIPRFDMYLEHLGVNHEEAAKCDLVCGGSVWLTDSVLPSCFSWVTLGQVWPSSKQALKPLWSRGLFHSWC